MATGVWFAGACPECGTSIYVRMEFLTKTPIRMAYTCPECEAFILSE
jgi:predicted RNA-binding Zn-ribbon protein involved in translation (DUF1610 family)